MSLAAKSCAPCNGASAMSENQAKEFLSQLEGWELAADAKSISTKRSFKNFAQSLAFVNRVGEIAEQEKHHPDFDFGWGYASITLTTHDAGGLHENDFIMASKINGIG